MKVQVQVKPNQHADRLWRDGDGLVAHIRAVPKDGEANAYLVRFLAEQFGVAKSLVSITRGHISSHKTVLLEMPPREYGQKMDQLDLVPQRSLFEA